MPDDVAFRIAEPIHEGALSIPSGITIGISEDAACNKYETMCLSR